MSARFASRVEGPAAAAAGARTVRVWDAPVRVFHWLTVLCFAGAYLSAESERWRLLHVTLGCTLAGLVGFRLVWGLVGSRHARFANFVRGPRAVLRYLRSLGSGRPEHHAGHNPAGALAIVALLGLAVVVTASGWAVYGDLGPEAVAELHESAADAMLAVVGLHVAGVLLGSLLHRENLVRAMVTGRKAGRPDEAIGSRRRPVALAIVLAVLAFWWWQWQGAPAAALPGSGAAAGSADAQAAVVPARLVSAGPLRRGRDDD